MPDEHIWSKMVDRVLPLLLHKLSDHEAAKLLLFEVIKEKVSILQNVLTITTEMSKCVKGASGVHHSWNRYFLDAHPTSKIANVLNNLDIQASDIGR
jgi:hypothetical protein